MEWLSDGARFIHVLFGATGLVAFWIPVFAKKGAVNHVRFGKIFVWSAYVVLFAAAVALAIRLSGLVAKGIGPADQPAHYSLIVFLG